MKETKSIFVSKTFWLNTIAGILAIIALINPDFLSLLGIAPTEQVKVLTIIGTATSILNIIFRSLNGAPVSLTPKADNAVNNQ